MSRPVTKSITDAFNRWTSRSAFSSTVSRPLFGQARQAGAGMTADATVPPRTIAFSPLKAAGNNFSGLFSDSIDSTLFGKTSFDWDDVGKGRHDLVIFHWPTILFRPSSRKAVLKLLGRMVLDRLRHGTRYIWVVHNLEPHDAEGAPSELTTRLFLRLLDGLIFLSRHSRDELLRQYPSLARKRSLVTVHGRYGDHVAAPREFVAAQGVHRLLFFGLVREYKNVVQLVAEARRVTTAPFSLTVIGACLDPDLACRLHAAVGDDPRIRIDLRDAPVADDELERIIDAHDAVVLPYRRILNSGVALHSLGRNKPILAPTIGSLPELRDAVGNDWVHLFDEDISAERIEAFLADIARIDRPAPDLSPFDWSRVGADVTAFLRAL